MARNILIRTVEVVRRQKSLGIMPQDLYDSVVWVCDNEGLSDRAARACGCHSHLDAGERCEVLEDLVERAILHCEYDGPEYRA